jgi:hypothetical protein
MDNLVYTSVCRGSQGPLSNIEADSQTGGPPGCTTAPRTEAGGHTATPGGPTASRRRAACCCGGRGRRRDKAYGGYFEVFHALRAEDDESSPSVGGNFQSAGA